MKPKCRLYACVQFRGEWVCDSASKKDKKILCVEKETECNVCQTLIPTPQIPRALISHENEHGCTTGTQVSYPKISEFFEIS